MTNSTSYARSSGIPLRPTTAISLEHSSKTMALWPPSRRRLFSCPLLRRKDFAYSGYLGGNLTEYLDHSDASVPESVSPNALIVLIYRDGRDAARFSPY